MNTKAADGYTVVELMIVLAVTGALAVGVFAGITTQRRNSEFTQAVKAFEHLLNDIANDVNHGYFPKKAGINIECAPDNPGNTVQFSNPGFDKEQGTNDGCIFVGKAIQFRPNNDMQAINVYTLAGRRYVGNNIANLTQDLIQASPRVVRTHPGEPGITSGLTETSTLPLGLRVVDQSPNNLRAIVFATSFNQESLSGGTSGSPSTDIYSIHHPGGYNTNAIIARLHTPTAYTTVDTTNVARLCVELHGKWAWLNIGNQNHKLTVNTEFLGSSPCA